MIFDNPNIHFFSMLTAAIILSRTPLKKPFLWMETFFHELSHGLAALITFGWIHRIQLKFNGAGSCTTMGGMRIPTLLAGYAGAVTWGAVIYLAGWSMDNHGDVLLLHILMGTVVASALLWVRTLSTLIIMTIMFGIFWLPTQFQDPTIPAFAVEFIGIYILQSAISAPLDLIDGKHEGDGAALADITIIIPEGIWITLWFVYALVVAFWLWQVTLPIKDRLMWDIPYLPWI